MAFKLLDEMPFGKHRGRLIVDLVENEPSYMAWAVREKVIELDNEAYERLKGVAQAEGLEL